MTDYKPQPQPIQPKGIPSQEAVGKVVSQVWLE